MRAWALVLLSLAGCAASTREAAAPRPVELSVARSEVPGRARLIAIEDPSALRVEAVLAWSLGSSLDPIGREGLCELLGRTWSASPVLAELESELVRSGGSLTWSMRPDRLDLCVRAAPSELERALSTVCAVAASPITAEQEFELARARLALEVAERSLAPLEALEHLALGEDSPWIDWPTPESLARISLAELEAFRAAHIGSNRLTVGVHSAFELSRARELVDRASARLALVAPAPELRPLEIGWPNAQRPTLYVQDLAVEREELTWLLPGPVESDADAALLLAWAEWLALAHGVQIDVHVDGPLRGMIVGHASFGPGGAADGLAALERQLELDSLGELEPEVVADAVARARSRQLGSQNDPALRLAVELERSWSEPAPAAPWPESATAAELADAVARWCKPAGPWLHVSANTADLVQVHSLTVLVLDPTQRAAGTLAGHARAARLLEALGGRSRWAQLSTLFTAGTSEFDGSTIGTRQWRDLAHGALRQEQLRPAGEEVYVLTRTQAFSLRNGALADLDESLRARLQRSNERHLFQVLRDLARERGRAARIAEDGLLEIHSPAGLLCWIEFDAADVPLRLGWPPHGELEGGLFQFEEWSWAQGFAYPARVRQPERRVTSSTTQIELDPVLDARLFRRPEH